MRWKCIQRAFGFGASKEERISVGRATPGRQSQAVPTIDVYPLCLLDPFSLSFWLSAAQKLSGERRREGEREREKERGISGRPLNTEMSLPRALRTGRTRSSGPGPKIKREREREREREGEGERGRGRVKARESPGARREE